MKNSTSQGRPVLTTVSIALVCLIVVICGMAGYWMQSDMIRKQGQVLAGTATILGERIDRIFFDRYRDFKMLSSMGDLVNGDVSTITRTLKHVQNSYENAYEVLSVTDNLGQVIASTDSSLVGSDFGTSALFQTLQEQREIVIEDDQSRNVLPGHVGYTIGARLKTQSADQTFSGIVFAYVHMSELFDEFERQADLLRQQNPETSDFEWQLIRQDGVLLIDSVLEEIGKTNLRELSLPSVLAIATGQSGYLVETHALRNVKVITGYAQVTGIGNVSGFGLGVLFRQDQKEIIRLAWALQQKLFLVGLGVLMPFLGILIWSRRQVQKAQDSEREAQKVLQRWVEQLNAILESSPVATIIVTAEGHIEHMNRVAEKIFRCMPKQFYGCHVFQLISEREQIDEQFYASWLSTWFSETSHEHLKEQIGVRQDGTEFPIELRVCPLPESSAGVNPSGQLLNKVIMSIQDITERKQSELAIEHQLAHLEEKIQVRTADLQKAKEAAEKANNAKTLFMANISHELRTPMHAILSFASLGIDRYDSATPEKLLSYLTQIKEGGNRLLSLVNNLLDLSKLDAGRMVLDYQEVDIKSLLLNVRQQTDALLKEKGLVLSVDHWTDDTAVICDEARITQVLWNLVSNAIKFTPAGNRITLAFRSSLTRYGRRQSDEERVPGLLVTVRDGGPGIPGNELTSIFDQFVQSSTTRTGAGGTGLGLSISKEIIEAHGGSIWAENHHEVGALFHFLIPIRSPWPEKSIENDDGLLVKAP